MKTRGRGKKLISCILSLAMVLMLCVPAMGAETVTVEEAADAEILEAPGAEAIDIVDPEAEIDNRAQGDEWDYVLPDWDINTIPSQWNTSRYLISDNSPTGTVGGITDGNIDSVCYGSPFSYFFSPESPGDVVDIVDGKVVLSDPVLRKKSAQPYFYRAVDAGGGYFVLIRYNVTDGSFISYYPEEDTDRQYYFDVTYRCLSGKDNRALIEQQRCSNYYTVGTELQPIVQYSGRKKVWVNMAKGKTAKPSEDQSIFADAVLVFHDGATTKFVSGLPIKSIKAKNNIFATLSSTNLVIKNDSKANRYGWTKDDKEEARYTGYKSQPLLSATDNIYLKANSQPCFNIQVAPVKGMDKAAKAAVGAANKALKKENFNFQIARMYLGDTTYDRVPVRIDYRGSKSVTAEEYKKYREAEPSDKEKFEGPLVDAQKAFFNELKDKHSKYINTYSSVYRNYLEEAKKDLKIEDCIHTSSVSSDTSSDKIDAFTFNWERYRVRDAQGRDEYAYRPYGFISITNLTAADNNGLTKLPMYLNQELDYDMIKSNHLLNQGGGRGGYSNGFSNSGVCLLSNRYFGNYFDTTNTKGRTQLTEKKGKLKLKLCYRNAVVRVGGRNLNILVADLVDAALNVGALGAVGGIIPKLIGGNAASVESLDDAEAELSSGTGQNAPSSQPVSHGGQAYYMNRMMAHIHNILTYALGSDANGLTNGLKGITTGNAGGTGDALKQISTYLRSGQGKALSITVAEEIINAMVANGVPISLINKIVKCKAGFFKVKLTNTENGKGDIFVKQLEAVYPDNYTAVLGSDGEAEIAATSGKAKAPAAAPTYPVLVLVGKNNMEGAATMRLDTDGKTILLGNYKDDTYYWVDEED